MMTMERLSDILFGILEGLCGHQNGRCNCVLNCVDPVELMIDNNMANRASWVLSLSLSG